MPKFFFTFVLLVFSAKANAEDQAALEDSKAGGQGEKLEEEEESLKCRADFLQAYGINGEEKPKFEKMLLCPEVEFSCCSPFDEMKFHKSWHHFYRPKIEITHGRMKSRYEDLAEVVSFFKEFNFDDFSDRILPQMDKEALNLLIHIQNMGLDTELRPITNQLDTLIAFDIKNKRNFFCILCDFKNHEFFNELNQMILLNKTYCEQILSPLNRFLQARAKLLNPILLFIHKFMNYFDTNYFFRDDVALIKQVRRNMDLVSKCYPEDKS